MLDKWCLFDFSSAANEYSGGRYQHSFSSTNIFGIEVEEKKTLVVDDEAEFIFRYAYENIEYSLD